MLDDKVVIVTGAGRGIGRDIALLAAAEGAKVVVNDPGVSAAGTGHDDGPAAQVAAEIRAAGGTAVANTDSVAEWDSAHRIVRTATEAFGTLHAVVNNAGILRDRIFHNMSVDDWKAVIDVHLHGSFYMARAAAAILRSEERGAFVHMTSTSGLIGNFGQANYAAAKMGIVGLSKSIALDMQRFNVRSNCISPFAWSRLIGTIPNDSPEQAARLARMQAMQTAKVAPLAVYLLADEARHVSGQIFAVRANEIFLMGQSRPLRSVHRAEGWTPQTVAAHAMPALEASFYALDRSADVFCWDPV
ncbi:MAG TPA: SDR family oxidoreductase [Rubrivivax sp.]|nr:SDR family oxidoreductase [Rubrivivax sp.]HPO18660.1 SDR family oxidoreductase [Rubrivivax sp.]